MFLALKEIKKEKLRFTMIIFVTALIAFLIYFLSSLAFGLAQLNKTAIEYWQADGIVLSEAANQNIYASSIDEQVLIDAGIEVDQSINIGTASITINDQDKDLIDVVFMGVQPQNEDLVAPIIEGNAVESDHQIVLSSNIRNEYDIEIGDIVTVSTTNRQFEVVGFTENSNYNTIPVGYVHRDMASQAMMIYSTGDPEADAVSTPTPNMPIRVAGVVIYGDVDQQVLEDNNLEFIEMNQFIDSIPGYMAQVLTFGLMIVALAVISSIIIGIFMYILTLQKKPIFGILKIQGYRNMIITKSVIYQTFILISLGFLIGFGITLLTVYFIPSSVPVAISPTIFTIVTIFSILCSLIGSLFSVRTILKIDPLDAI